ncbi:hypothetical protein LR48_Vigan01g038700 [Vigna angularis]|uniref:Uncharacterized protein n=1 Tax=Phaseolus angularis TaxID=3914 RepID=A0A0L9TK62_PHAAN|nr:hypothetical protein LR48_Vigan01g038700 [Vigna angularis]
MVTRRNVGDQQDLMELIREMQRQMKETQRRDEAKIAVLRVEHVVNRQEQLANTRCCSFPRRQRKIIRSKDRAKLISTGCCLPRSAWSRVEMKNLLGKTILDLVKMRLKKWMVTTVKIEERDENVVKIEERNDERRRKICNLDKFVKIFEK